MDDINIGRFKSLFKVMIITNLITSGVITHEQALNNSAYRHFLKDELQLDSKEMGKQKILAKVQRSNDQK